LTFVESIDDQYDAVVIGTGAGGGSAGYKLASAGKKVLFVERGPLFDDPEAIQDERAMQIEKQAADNRVIDFGRVKGRVFTGGIAGGGTSLYGACLMRPGAGDFCPGKYYSRYLDRSLWQWPVSYDEMAPFYTEAEALYKVAGLPGQVIPYLYVRACPYAAEPLPLHPTNQMLMGLFQKHGLHPFILPMGIDPGKCARCPTCPGYICPQSARASSLLRCIQPAIANHGADLVTRAEVTRVTTSGGRVKELFVKLPSKEYGIRTDLLVLAAGAIGTPVFLMQHHLTGGNPNVGRNFMFHLGVIFSALCTRPTGAGQVFTKQLGITDFYHHYGTQTHKLGYIQQLPIPGVLTMDGQLPLPIPKKALQWALYRNITFAGAIEDLPQSANRVMLGSNGITIRHRYHPYDLHRGRLMKQKFSPAMRRIPASIAFAMVAKEEKLHTAHQVGTCRMGVDPRTSVVDQHCRLHHMDNVYIVDGSVLPMSLGVAPALTIMANALRVSSQWSSM
jgi:choline dehydrogenase-like flavoprotein